MDRIKIFFHGLFERVANTPKPVGDYKDKLSVTFFLDIYCLLFVAFIMYPFNGYFNILATFVFFLSALVAAFPFIKWKVFPSFVCFFRNKTKSGIFTMGYFILLFLTFLVVYIHSKFFRGLDVFSAKFLVGYYTLIFVILPITVMVIHLKKGVVKVIDKIRK